MFYFLSQVVGTDEFIVLFYGLYLCFVNFGICIVSVVNDVFIHRIFIG